MGDRIRGAAMLLIAVFDFVGWTVYWTRLGCSTRP
jgi:hypothetical protein